MTLRIISTADIVFEGPADSVTLPGALGTFTVLPRHAALISTLVSGDIVCRSGEEEKRVHTAGGLVEVVDDVVSVCIY